MAIEAGAKNGIFPVDDKTMDYIKGRVNRDVTAFKADADAEYEQTIEIDLSALRPTVACPHLPENTKTIDELGHIEVQQVGHRLLHQRPHRGYARCSLDFEGPQGSNPNVRTIIIPATQDVYLQCIEEGLTKIFIQAGAIVSTPTCGPCLGGHMGILAHGERAVSTTNRNFVGRMGHITSEIYLASPAVAAASAVAGYICAPDDLK